MKNAALSGKPYAGNPHVRFDEGEVASAKPRRGSLLYKTILLSVGAALAAVVAFADDSEKVATWVGGESSAWNNPANWAEGVVPGRYIAKDSAGNTVTNGTRGWTARFCRSDARWVVEFQNQIVSVSNVIFSGANATTRFGSGTSHILYLEEGGTFQVCEDIVNMPDVKASIVMGGMQTSYPVIHLRNDCTTKTLIFPSFDQKCTQDPGCPFNYPRFSFEGKGTVRQNGSGTSNSGYRPSYQLAMDEGGVYEVGYNVGGYRGFDNLLVPEGLTKQHISIDADKCIKPGVRNTELLTVKSDLEIGGEGSVKFGNSGAKYAAASCVNVAPGVTLDLNVPGSYGPAATDGTGCLYLKGGGVMRATKGLDFPSDFVIFSSATLEVPTLANNLQLYSGGKFRYVGEGGTIDQTVKLVTTKNTEGVLEQAGTGKVTFAGDVSATVSGMTLVLLNESDVPAELSGAVLTGNPSVAKRGAGEWILSGANTTTGAFTLEAGTLTVANAASLPRLTVKGEGVLKIVDGVTVSASLTYTSGKLNVVTGEGAKFKTTSFSGIAPDWLTINGSPAKFNSSGELVSMDGYDVEIAAHGGVVPDNANAVVGITTAGTSGPVTLEKAATKILALNQDVDEPAVVRFEAGEKLTVENVIVKTNAQPLVLGDISGVGTVDTAGNTLKVNTQADDSVASIRAALVLAASKTIWKLGAGTLCLPDDWNWTGTLQLDEGRVMVTNVSGATPQMQIKGLGTIEYAGTADKTLSTMQPDFKGRTVFDGGANKADPMDALGVDQQTVPTVTTTVEIKEGADLEVKAGFAARNVIAGGAGTDGTGAIKLNYTDNQSFGLASLDLTSDLVITGYTGMGTKFIGFRRWLDGTNCFLRMNGHKLTKVGNGRILMKDGVVTDPGEIEFVYPSGLWMQDGFYLGKSETAPLTLTKGASANLQLILTQDRPLKINGRSSIDGSDVTLDSPDLNVWNGPVEIVDGGLLSARPGRSSQLVFGGQVKGPGDVAAPYEASGLVSFTNEHNRETWTGKLSFDGERGVRVHAAYPTSIPPANLVSGTYSRVIAPMPNWTKADILDYANNAALSGTAYVSADTSALADGSTFELSDADVTGDDFGLGHDGTNTMNLVITGPISKAIGLAGFRGTMKVSADDTVKLSRLIATSDAKDRLGKVVFDGALDVRLVGHSVRIGANEYGRDGVASLGEIEVRNSSIVNDDLTKDSPGLQVGAYSPGVLRVGEGAVITSCFHIAAYTSVNNSHGAIYQTDGELVRHRTGGSTYEIMGSAGALGYHEIRGGHAVYAGSPRVALNGPAVIAMYGGELEVGAYALASDDSWTLGYCHGTHLYMKGGHFTTPVRCYAGGSGGSTIEMRNSTIITLDGPGALFDVVDNYLYLGRGARTSGIPVPTVLNLNGGVLCCNAAGRYPNIYGTNDAVQCVYVNFGGGTVRARKNNYSLFGSGNGSYPTRVNRVTVFAGGATVDTAGLGASIYPPLEKPTGNGVVSIAVPDEVAATDLVAPPYIEIFDFEGEGQGATAYAEFDSATRTVSRVIVTSPGWNYTSAKAVFKFGGAKVCTNDCVIAANQRGGGLTKIGEGKLTLYGANTYEGDTVVKGGEIVLANDRAIPATSAVRLEGGTLNLNGRTVDVSRVTGGSGSITNGKALLPGLTIDLADAIGGVYTTYDCDVGFADGAKITILNGQLAQDESFTKCVLAKFKGGLENLPVEVEGVDGLGKTLKLTNRGGTLRLGKITGSLLIVR